LRLSAILFVLVVAGFLLLLGYPPLGFALIVAAIILLAVIYVRSRPRP
jgi:hypothetical protein